jgi:hypothetical protein
MTLKSFAECLCLFVAWSNTQNTVIEFPDAPEYTDKAEFCVETAWASNYFAIFL